MSEPARTSKKSQRTPSGAATLTQRLRNLNRWREQLNPLRGLTLQRAVTLGESYFRGEMADLQWTYFWIEQTDADMLALLECRFGRLLEMDYHCKVEGEAAKKDKALADEQIAALAARFEKIDNLYEAIEHLGMASFRGFAHCEFHEAGGEVVHLEVVDQWNAVRDGLHGEWKYNPEARTTTFRALPDSHLMPAERFLFREVRRPIGRPALFKAVRSNLSDKDWDAFNEIYGIPSGVVIGPPNIPEGKETEYEEAAGKIAEGGSGYLPHGSTYTANTAARGEQPFKARLDHLSEKLVLAGTGGKLTMLTEAGSGTLAGGAHADVFEQIAKAEARRISECFNRQLVTTWLERDFPGQKQLAYFELAANEEADVSQIVDHVAKLAQAGYIVEPQQVQEKTGYSVTVKPAPEPPPAVAGNPFRNRAAGRAAVFNATAAQRIGSAEMLALRPLLVRLSEIEKASDGNLPELLNRLKADLPKLQAEALRKVPEIAPVWEEVLGSAFVDGVVSAASEKAEKTAVPLSSPAVGPQNRRKAPMQGHARPPTTP